MAFYDSNVIAAGLSVFLQVLGSSQHRRLAGWLIEVVTNPDTYRRCRMIVSEEMAGSGAVGEPIDELPFVVTGQRKRRLGDQVVEQPVVVGIDLQGILSMTARCGSPSADESVLDGEKSTSVLLSPVETVGIRVVSDQIWLVSFMNFDLGFFNQDEDRVDPALNPFAPEKVLTMSPGRNKV